MSDNDTNPQIDGTEPDDEPDADTEQSQPIEFTADVAFRVTELRRMIEEADVGLSNTQRDQVNEILAEWDPEPDPDPDPDPDSPPDSIVDRIETLDTEISRLRETRENFERKVGLRGQSWTVGPKTISSQAAMHSTPLWGVHFETQHDLTLGDTTIRSLQPGTVTIRAFEWTGERGTLGDVLGEKVVRCTGGEQTIHLDIDIPANTSVLLARPYPASREDALPIYSALPDQAFKPSDDDTSLAREQYDGWEADSKHGVQFHGKGHPIFTGSEDQYWYYFYSLEVTTDDEPAPETVPDLREQG